MAHPIPSAALEYHIGILGKTGSGKSYAAQGIAERLIRAKERVCIIDPTDRYWGLRLMADGKTPSGFDIVIFGGAHGDMPLAATHGAALAEIIGTSSTSAIIATRLLGVNERAKFFTDFALKLVEKNDGPLHLIIDEAHLFAPQQGARAGGGIPALVNATNNLVSLGRGLGLRIILVSQRPAKLHKDSLTQVESLIAMRLIAPQDRNAIDDWVADWADKKTGEEIKASLPSLSSGDAWLWSPEIDILKRVHFPVIGTYDSGKPPAAGKRGPELKPIDLATVRGKLEIVAKDAAENDPKRLKAEVARLTRELSTAKSAGAGASSAELGAAKKAAFDEGRSAGYAAGVWDGQNTARLALEQLKPVAAAAHRAVEVVQAALVQKPIPSAMPDRPTARQAPVAAPRKPSPAASGQDSEVGQGGLRRILVALAQRPEGLTNRQIGVRAGLSSKSGTFSTYISKARSSGWVEGHSPLVITKAGIEALGDYDPLPTGRDLLDHWLGELGDSGAARLLKAIADAYPNTLTNAEAGERASLSHQSGTFSTYLSKLRTLELIEGRGELRAADELFS